MHQSKLIMITCVMKVKENTCIILLYEKVQLNAYKRLFDNEYLISNMISIVIHVYEIYFSDTKNIVKKT